MIYKKFFFILGLIFSTSSAGFETFNLLPTAYLVGHSGAVCAHLGSVDAVIINPAAIADINKISFRLTHNQYLVDTRYHAIQFAIPFKIGNIAGGVSHFSSGKIDRVLGDGSLAGSFDISSTYLFIGFARRFIKNVYLGVNIKPIFERLEEEDASTVAIDLGLLYHEVIPKLNFGFSLRNVGASTSFLKEKVDLPLSLILGCNYRLLAGDLVASLDIEHRLNNTFFIRGSCEYKLLPYLDIYTGLSSNPASLNIGARFSIKGVIIDYAHMSHPTLGHADHFSVGVEF